MQRGDSLFRSRFPRNRIEAAIFLAHNILGRDNKYICRVIIPFNNSSWSVGQPRAKKNRIDVWSVIEEEE